MTIKQARVSTENVVTAAASRAARTLAKLGASKGGKVAASRLTREQRQARAKNAVTARWARVNGDRLTHDQERVMRRQAGRGKVTLEISDGPCGKRRLAAISQLVTAGRILVLRVSGQRPDFVTIKGVQMSDNQQRKEAFEVVMIKNGKTEQSAAIEDFRRVRIDATDPLQAFTHEDVQNMEGYYPILTAKPGVLTDAEIHARARAFEASNSNPRQW